MKLLSLSTIKREIVSMLFSYICLEETPLRAALFKIQTEEWTVSAEKNRLRMFTISVRMI